MSLNLKLRHKTQIPPEVKEYVEKRMQKIMSLIPQNAFVEIEFIDDFGSRGGIDKKVEIDMTIPGEKKALHLKNAATDWFTSIDVLKDRLENEILRHKQKIIDSHRRPREDKV